jgi:hypothetical protein
MPRDAPASAEVSEVTTWGQRLLAALLALAGTTTVLSEATRSRRNGFAGEGVPFALCALVAVIGTAGQRAGRPRSDLSDEVGRALMIPAE